MNFALSPPHPLLAFRSAHPHPHGERDTQGWLLRQQKPYPKSGEGEIK